MPFREPHYYLGSKHFQLDFFTIQEYNDIMKKDQSEMTPVRNQVKDQVRDQVYDQVRDQVWDKVQ